MRARSHAVQRKSDQSNGSTDSMSSDLLLHRKRTDVHPPVIGVFCASHTHLHMTAASVTGHKPHYIEQAGDDRARTTMRTAAGSIHGPGPEIAITVHLGHSVKSMGRITWHAVPGANVFTNSEYTACAASACVTGSGWFSTNLYAPSAHPLQYVKCRRSSATSSGEGCVSTAAAWGRKQPECRVVI
jgi:hypothetical protein